MPAVQFKRCSFPSSHFLLRRTDALMRLKLLRRSRGSLYESRNPASADRTVLWSFHSTPLPMENSLPYWSALMRASTGVAFCFCLIMTTPLVRSLYSTEGIPRMISTLSMLSVEMLRMSTPAFTALYASNVVLGSVSNRCILASVLMGAPSMMNLVPKEEVL